MMMADSTRGHWQGVNELVEIYESAQARDGHAEVADFLPSPEHPEYLAVLCELIRVDLEYSWQRGRPKRLEQYQGAYPDLFRDRQRVREIVFEECRLRRQAGEDPSPLDYRQRFGMEALDWPASPFNGAIRGGDSPTPEHESRTLREGGEEEGVALAARAYRSYRLGLAEQSAGLEDVFASHRVSRDHAALFRDLHRSDPREADRLAHAVADLPEPGTDFLGFHLCGELGRGAFGRVYLARQGDLADRPVALKISADVADETRTLAQLQHTNIVPIHSVHRLGSLQAVCMPYLGSTTLADVLLDLKRHESLPDSGAGLLSSWKTRKSRVAGAPSADSARREMTDSPGGEAEVGEVPRVATAPAEGRATVQVERLRGLGYSQAVLWLMARLADGLAHAHERGILHRDLKPANVLFADDGEPLLLDFNLAADTKLRGHASAAMVGGTLPYMAPEHLAAFLDGSRPADARSDVYSLGVILHELLSGRNPFPIHRGPVDEVLPRMIADRQIPYPAIRSWNPKVSPAVESIVRHCLAPDPASRYQTARALQEDLQRQLDDLPLKHAPEPSLRERLGKWARRHPRLTSSTSVGIVAACLLMAVAAGFLVRQTNLRSLEAADSFRRLSDEVQQVNFLLGSRDAAPQQVDEGIAECQNALGRYGVLDDPAWPSSPLVGILPEGDRRRLREDVGEILFLWARAVARRAADNADAAKRVELAGFALRLNRLAEAGFGRVVAPKAWWLQRADLEQLAGRDGEARRLREHAETVPLGTPKERLLMVSDRLDRASLREFLPFVRESSRIDPQDFANWLGLGNLYVQLGKDTHQTSYLDEAEHCYSVGIGLRRDNYWAYLNRGLLYLDLKNYQRARDDFDKVIALRPDLAMAYLNRGLARLGLDDARGAVDDLTRALDFADAPTQALFIRARALAKLGDREGAGRDRAEGLRRVPNDEVSWIPRGWAKLPGDPPGALADFDAALALNPRSRPALQNKANVLAENLGRPEDAIRVLGTALEHHPGSVNALAGRGVLLARLGRREAALRDAQAALTLGDTALTLYQVAGLYALTSRENPEDYREALRLMAAALRKDPSWLKVVPGDTDLAPIRDRAEFRELLRAAAVVSENELPSRSPLLPRQN
jgi:serine/threonine protein kinase/tetratricopeptide (TPR) repeat protein